MSIYDKQLTLFLGIEALVNKDCVMEVNGFKFITDSTILTVMRQFYDVDTVDEDNGDVSMYITLKEQFKDCGFIDDYRGVGYLEPIINLGIKDKEVARLLQLRYCLHEFPEVDLIEMLYLDAVVKQGHA